MLLSRETEIGYRRFINEIDTVEKPPFNRRESAFPPRFSSMLLLFFYRPGSRTKGSRIGERERERAEDSKGERLLSGDPSMDWFLGGLTVFDFVRR